MAQWLDRIEGVAPLIERYETEEPDLRVVAASVAERLRNTSYYTDDEEFAEHVDELVEVESETEFDGVLDSIYDWCDANRIWIDPNK